jgi:hypothetical protein
MKTKLPIGIQSFVEMRTGGYAYADKTPLIARMAEEGKYYFLSRPRRFGKSLLVDTLAEAFAGHRELFAGLHLERNWDWSRSHPVVRFDFSGGVLRDAQALDRRIHQQLRANAARHDLALPEEDVVLCFEALIEQLHAHSGERVVILVDEYDKPILDNLTRTDIATELRDGLRNLYSVIKGQDAHLRFVLLTGVSKFSKVSIFSGLNNLLDITLDPPYATLCGYTQGELEGVFAGWLEGLDLDAVREWYNGYSFLGEPVYNPFDVLLYLRSRQFHPHWFETGTPSFLIDLLRRHRRLIPELGGFKASEDLLGAFDVDHIEPEALLFQTGYATILSVSERPAGPLYTLGFPNREVRISLPRAILGRYLPDSRAQVHTGERLWQALEHDEPAAMEPALHALFASIPHDWYRNNRLSDYEGYYASLVYCAFAAIGADVVPEEVTYRGQVDLAVRYGPLVWLIEFKLDDVAGPASALEQIRARGYHHKYAEQRLSLIGINFDRAARNLSGFAWERVPAGE